MSCGSFGIFEENMKIKISSFSKENVTEIEFLQIFYNLHNTLEYFKNFDSEGTKGIVLILATTFMSRIFRGFISKKYFLLEYIRKIHSQHDID